MNDLFLTFLIFVVAVLYSSVGHGGASGYLAAMGLVGLSPAIMKPGALLLNLLVSGIATLRFCGARQFAWPIFWPFAAASIPLAYVGGTMSLPGRFYKGLVAMVLFYAAWRMFSIRAASAAMPLAPVPKVAALTWGAAIGLLSGMVGVGGGIFLSPLLILMGWADPRRSAGISAAFIFVNSVAGLAGHMSTVGKVPSVAWLWGVAAVAGGLLGSELGARHFGFVALRRLLGLVLIIAAIKMLRM